MVVPRREPRPRVFLLLPRVEGIRGLFRVHPRIYGSLPVRRIPDIQERREIVRKACLLPAREKEVPRLRRRLRLQGDSQADKPHLPSSGQQRHRETEPLCLTVKEELAVLRLSQGSRTGSHVLFPCLLVQAKRSELL